MNRTWERRVPLEVVLAVVALVLMNGSTIAHGQTMSMSIPSLHITSGERVVGFDIHITSGRIAEVPNVPIGWDVSIDNNASWNTEIKASSTVGAAAVGPNFFRQFLVVEKNETLGVPFDIHGEVVVTEDFASERRIKIGIKDLMMKKSEAKGVRNNRNAH